MPRYQHTIWLEDGTELSALMVAIHADADGRAWGAVVLDERAAASLRAAATRNDVLMFDTIFVRTRDPSRSDDPDDAPARFWVRRLDESDESAVILVEDR